MTVNASETTAAAQRWPGWPGDNVFRIIVPVAKVGGIIGKGGELVKKLAEDTGARVRVLDGPFGAPDRIVLISGKEEPEAGVSPAMEAVLRVFKRINSVSEDGKTTSDSVTCLVRLLMPAVQAIHLIGKQGSSIKSIQDESGATVNVLTIDERAFYAKTDERIVVIQGEYFKVHKALEAVLGQLRKFLVDHGVIPLFEKSLSRPETEVHGPNAWLEQNQSLIHSPQQTGVSNDYPLPLRRDPLFLDRETTRDSLVLHNRLSPYDQRTQLSDSLSSGLMSEASALVTQVTQTMQIPLRYAEEIVGSGGSNIAYIRARSGAAIEIMERGFEMIVEIKGRPKKVQIAHQLIEDSLTRHSEPGGGYSLPARPEPVYSRLPDTGYPSSSIATQAYSRYEPLGRSESSFSDYAGTMYPSSSLPSQTYDEYMSSRLPDHSRYRY